MLQKIDPKQITKNPFSLIGDQWMLVTAGTREKCNTMTASWGGVGIMWGAPCATIYIRPQRYTYEFVESSDYFTLSFLPESRREALKLCGSKSGRDMDKIAACGLTIAGGENAPYFEEAELVLVCKKLYWNDLEPGNLDLKADRRWYPNHDYHRMYIGQIVEAWQNI